MVSRIYSCKSLLATDAAFRVGEVLHAQQASKTIASGKTWTGNALPDEPDDAVIRTTVEGINAAMNRLNPKERAAVAARTGFSGSQGWTANGAGISTAVDEGDTGHLAPDVAETMRTISQMNERNRQFHAADKDRNDPAAGIVHDHAEPKDARALIQRMNDMARRAWGR
ncbi:MAG TPA: hypothetical protein VHZ53_14005 [Steroidobacteraceae bacterium]|nr:hypothetical protein [Steroidobacteraceae bacterium]